MRARRCTFAIVALSLAGCGVDDSNERLSAAFAAFAPFSPSIRTIKSADYIPGMKTSGGKTFMRSPQVMHGPENIDVSEREPCVFRFAAREYGNVRIKTFDANKLYLETIRFASSGNAVDTAFALRPVTQWMEIPGMSGAVIEDGKSESKILIGTPVKPKYEDRMKDRDAILSAIRPLRKFCKGL